MKITRRFTEAGKSPYDKIPFRKATSEIRNPDGSVVFQLEDFMVPENWSQVAADILAQKYFRKAGVPARLKRVEENTVPSWLWRSVPDEAALKDLAADERYGRRNRLAPESSTASPAPGPTGAGRAAISRPKTTPAPSSTRHRYMLAIADGRAQLARNGSTPVCTGPTASMARARATTTSTTRPAN